MSGCSPENGFQEEFYQGGTWVHRCMCSGAGRIRGILFSHFFSYVLLTFPSILLGSSWGGVVFLMCFAARAEEEEWGS